MNQARVVIELPEDLCAEALRDGLGTRVLAHKRSTMHDLALVIGLGGSAISLMQGPETIRAFCKWLIWRTRRNETIIQVRRRRNGDVECTLGPNVDTEAALEFLTSCLEK